MKNVIPFTLALTIPVIAWFGIEAGGPWVLSGFIFSFVIHPILDILFGKNHNVVEKGSVSGTAYSFILWIYFPLQILFLYQVLNLVSVTELTNWALWGIILSTGAITGGLGINIAHELVHRRARWERGIGVGLLLLVNYAHFRVEHVFGHHKHVSTPNDPASARAGESIYKFLARSIIMSWISAWRIEAKRKPLHKNRLVHYIIVQSILILVSFGFFGVVGGVVYLGQSAVAILTLESINYIEHYGLERKEISPGVYEAVTELHSWDSSHRMTNWFLFNLGRHAHHHASPTVPYHELKTSKTDNQLKYGYSTEILLAYIGKNSKR